MVLLLQASSEQLKKNIIFTGKLDFFQAGKKYVYGNAIINDSTARQYFLHTIIYIAR
jgi:hypothetical protein